MKEQLARNERTLYFRDSAAKHGFTQVENILLRDGSLSDGAVRLYALLKSYAWQEKECYPGHMKLADNMGCKRKKISALLIELKNRRLISWSRRGLGLSNVYVIESMSEGYSTGKKQIVDKAGVIA